VRVAVSVLQCITVCALQCIAVSVSQCIVACVLQCIAVCVLREFPSWKRSLMSSTCACCSKCAAVAVYYSMRVVMYCSRCVAVRCSALQRVAEVFLLLIVEALSDWEHLHVLQCVQCVAVSVFQCVAVHVLQCMCCIVFSV